MDKILSYYQDAKKLIKRELVIPRMVSIWPSHACNLNCDFCGYANMHDGINMKEEDFKRLLDQLSSWGIEGLEFSGGGEPTINPKCFEFAELANKAGLKVGMFTNGTRFDWDRVGYFDYIRIGLDAVNSMNYSKIKHVREEVFTKVIDNIKKLMECKDRPFVGLKFVITENNYFGTLSFASLAKSLGVDYVSFRKIFEKPNEELDNIAKSLLAATRAMHPNFLYGEFAFEDLKEPCFMAPIHTVITADGNLLNCCYFNDEDHVIGNVFKYDFDSVWFSKRHWKILDSISPTECNNQTCRWRKYNNLMKDLLLKKHFISFI